MFNHIGVTNVEDSIYQLSTSCQRSIQRFTLSLANLLVRALTVCTYLFNHFKIYLTVYDNELFRYSTKPTILYSNHAYCSLQILGTALLDSSFGVSLKIIYANSRNLSRI